MATGDKQRAVMTTDINNAGSDYPVMPLKTIDSAPDPTHTGNLISSAAVAEGLATKVPVVGKGINLFDNADFRNPVNQRGQTSYPNGGYGIDRWYGTGAVTVQSGYLAVADSIFQRKENVGLLAGGTLTFSALLTNNTLITGSAVFAGTASDTVFFASGGKQLLFNSYWGGFQITGSNIIAAKLELGPVQTLAHQVNGTWVLNDTPRYDDELRKCLEHQYLPFANAYGTTAYLPAKLTVINNGDANTDALVLVRMETPVPMRINPNGYYTLSFNYSNWVVRNYTKNSYIFAKASQREGYGHGYVSFVLKFDYGAVSMGDELVIYGQSNALSNPQCFVIDNNL